MKRFTDFVCLNCNLIFHLSVYFLTQSFSAASAPSLFRNIRPNAKKRKEVKTTHICEISLAIIKMFERIREIPSASMKIVEKRTIIQRFITEKLAAFASKIL